MQILEIDIDNLYQDPNNVRLHDDKNLDAIKGSLKKFGQQKPIVIDRDNIIIAGNGTQQAAKSLGWKTISCVRSSLENFDKMAYALADNRSAELATWDMPKLEEQLKFIDEPDLIGFDDEFISLDDPSSTPEQDEKEDDIPEFDDNPYGVERGDIWKLGNHRLVCGDSTNPDDVALLMDGERADMVFTDPPYNVASHSSNFVGDRKTRDGWYGTAMTKLKESEWDKDFNIGAWLPLVDLYLMPDSVCYIWSSHFLINEIWDGLKTKFDYYSYIIWSKTNPMPSLAKKHPVFNTEIAAYFAKGNKRKVNYPKGENFLSCRIVAKKSDGSHPTQKPIELIAPLIAFHGNENDIVADYFMGSGSTLIACEKTNRKCFGMEIDTHYCSVIIKRWEDYTGNKGVKLNARG